MSAGRILRFIFFLFLALLVLGRSDIEPGDRYELARAYTRNIEFDYVSWTLDALWGKLNQWALGTGDYLLEDTRKQIVLDYLALIGRIQQVELQLNDIYADPGISDPQQASTELRKELNSLRSRRSRLEPLAEAVLQSQISDVVSDLGLTLGGQPIPPVLFHTTPPPDSLVVSPREVVRHDFDISIKPGLTADQQNALEEQVDQALNVSSLVVGIGGVGLYPTMVMQTTDINWLAETVSHEWVHNFLTLRLLGINYETSPELRIMNETTASIAGVEIGRAIVARFYPEYLPPPPEPQPVRPGETAPEPAPAPVFSFQREMHDTRVMVDKLLAEGKIDEAEAYMEARRRLFWENGYHIRKLNQAYFAFYGAYADSPAGGAAGEDPVGAAVRALRTQSSSLTEFLNRISWMTSFNQLRNEVEKK